MIIALVNSASLHQTNNTRVTFTRDLLTDIYSSRRSNASRFKVNVLRTDTDRSVWGELLQIATDLLHFRWHQYQEAPT